MIFENNINSGASVDAISQFKKGILKNTITLKKGSAFIFTCGARPNKKQPTGRDLLMNYASRHLTEFNFFMAEDIFEALRDHKSDLLTIESSLADYSDCIIIVLESESTYSELGAFTMHDPLAENVLVINDERFRTSESFITNGPLEKLEQKSRFKPVVHVKYETFSRCFTEVETRLKKIKKGKGTKVDFTSYQSFKSALPKKRLLFILDLISIFSPIKTKELISLLKFIFGDHSYEINVLLALLISLRLIEPHEKYYIRTLRDAKLFYTYQGVDMTKVRTLILQNYFKNNRDRYQLLNNRIS